MVFKCLLIAMAVLCAFLGYRVLRLESEVHQLQRNAAIAISLQRSRTRRSAPLHHIFDRTKRHLPTRG